jgi:hypothetical protein
MANSYTGILTVHAAIHTRSTWIQIATARRISNSIHIAQIIRGGRSGRDMNSACSFTDLCLQPYHKSREFHQQVYLLRLCIAELIWVRFQISQFLILCSTVECFAPNVFVSSHTFHKITLIEMSTRNLPGGGGEGGRAVRPTTLPPSVSRLSRENVGTSTSHSPKGLHGLL